MILPPLKLKITLESDTIFGRGDRQVGVVDQEIEHDPFTGLPFVKGRTIKGLLVEECANVLFSIQQFAPQKLEVFEMSAGRLFGVPGSGFENQALLAIGSAQLPEDFRQQVALEIAKKQLRPNEVLEAMTTIYRQTAVDYTSGTPKDGSLRSMRALLRETILYAFLHTRIDLTLDDWALLGACAASLRRAGTERNRGRGRLRVELIGADGKATSHLAYFKSLILGKTIS